MVFRISRLVASGAVCLVLASPLLADTIQLVNGDRLNGKVTSLDDKQLVVDSESFGELKIARDKVDLISLGDKGIPDFQQVIVPQQPPAGAPNAQPLGGNLNNVSPLLQDPAVRQQLGPMVEQLLGPNGGRDTQQNVEEARRGLHELREDFGDGPEGKALDAYIRFFEQIAPMAGGTAPQKAKPQKGRRIRPAKTNEPAKKSEPTKPAEQVEPAEVNEPNDAGKPAPSKSAEQPANANP